MAIEYVVRTGYAGLITADTLEQAQKAEKLVEIIISIFGDPDMEDVDYNNNELNTFTEILVDLVSPFTKYMKDNLHNQGVLELIKWLGEYASDKYRLPDPILKVKRIGKR
jgi:hypothetical protein